MIGQRAGVLLAVNLAQIPGTGVEDGLTTAELDEIEQRFEFAFADDHRAFLATAAPVGPRWPDWRGGDEAALRRTLERPVQGVLFDIEHNAVWPVGWGPRPATVGEAVAVARARLASVPQLVPVYGHRCLPAGRGAAGHPVLSVSRTDVIVCGLDLADYLHQEFGVGRGIARHDARWRPRVTVPFWRDFIA